MSDILQVQEFIFGGMKSCALFDKFNVVLERDFMAQSQVEISSLWLTPRNPAPAEGDPGGPSQSGIGILVEMPRLELSKPNSLQRNLIASVVLMEERNLNMGPMGTKVSAEELAELSLDFMFGWVMGLSSALVPEVGAIKPAPDVIQGDGLIVYRAAVSLRREHRATDRCDTPALVEGSPGSFTFTNGVLTPDADIYYTVAQDAASLSLPGKDNPDAVRFNGSPVALSSGQCINWAAWRGDRLPSHIIARQVT